MSELKTPTVAENDEFTARVVSTGNFGTPCCYLPDGRVCFLTEGKPAKVGQWVKAVVTMSGSSHAKAEALEVSDFRFNEPGTSTIAEVITVTNKAAQRAVLPDNAQPFKLKPVAVPKPIVPSSFSIDSMVRGVDGNKNFSIGEEHRKNAEFLAGKDVLVSSQHGWSFRSYVNAVTPKTMKVHIPACIDHNFEKDTSVRFTLTVI